MSADLQSLPLEVIAEELLWRKARSFKDDPLGFVRWAFPWGEPAPLAIETGPDEVQEEFLTPSVTKCECEPVRSTGKRQCSPSACGESIGHGTGKSAMGAWLAWWIQHAAITRSAQGLSLSRRGT
jgi:hypothetical protein